MYLKSFLFIRPVFSRVDKKRRTYNVKESVHLNRPTVEPNRIRKHGGRRGSGNGENCDQPTSNNWAVRRNLTQVLQLGELYPLTMLVYCYAYSNLFMCCTIHAILARSFNVWQTSVFVSSLFSRNNCDLDRWFRFNSVR